MSTLFGGDLHFGDFGITKYQSSDSEGNPFKSVKERDECLLTLWNEKVHSKDVVIINGDLISHNEKPFEWYLKRLNGILVLVPGNHDYDQKEYFTKINEKVKWKVLTNTYEYIYTESDKPMVFVGVDDYWLGDPSYKDAYQFLNESTKDIYTVLLLHEPDQVEHLNDYTEDTNYSFNIALAGHSHLGQVRLPFIGALWTPYGSKKYYDEYYKLGDNKDLYISGGLGTSGLKLRFFNK